MHLTARLEGGAGGGGGGWRGFDSLLFWSFEYHFKEKC